MREKIENLFGLPEEALQERIAPLESKSFHAGQIFHWIHGRGVTDFRGMTDLPHSLRDTLVTRFRLDPPCLDSEVRSADGTTKFVIRMEDGERVESVLIPEGRRLTLCISSQVGCALGCRFCLTASMGLRRNLSPAEIVGQIWILRREANLFGRKVNVVLMGMGEPLQNLESVMTALKLLASPKSFDIPYRRFTLSTVGYVPGIQRLALFPNRPRLAVSLSATTDEQRDHLLPINQRYPLRTLLSTLRDYPLKGRERLTFEYVLLGGVNDTLADASRLARLLGGIRSKVNLIRYNRTGRGDFSVSPEQQVRRFRDHLLQLGVPVSLRKRKGEEIFAACGQLALHRPGVPSVDGGSAGV